MIYTIKQKAEELAHEAPSHQELLHRIANFVRDEICYCLDEWNVSASEVLRKGRGMCAGKALLAAEMFRTLGMPCRFKVVKMLGEEGLFQFIRQRLEEKECLGISKKDREKVLNSIISLPPDRDHIIVQIFLNFVWIDLDVARDRALDFGMRVLGICRDRKIISEDGPFDSIDRWVEERMQCRTILKDRKVFFQVINQQIEKIRLVGMMALKEDTSLQK
jgi:transglutaminase-like putative cysteine protease